MVPHPGHGHLSEILSPRKAPLAPTGASAYHFGVRPTAVHLFGFSLLAAACQGTDGADAPVATRTHALLRVERSAHVGEATPASGLAFAGVVRVPEFADPEPLLQLSGRGPTLPAAGQCLAVNHERDALLARDLSRAEFLDAGEVLFGTSDAQTLLAPRAFPMELSGVVYTSRDQATEALPSGVTYLLKTTGSPQLPSLELRIQAPEELRDVTVNGSALGALDSVSTEADVPVTWRPGDSGDLVYVEVLGPSEVGSVGVCAFRDGDGRGSLPRGLFGVSGNGSLALHRLREVAADVPALDGAEVRFDFAMTAAIAFR